MFKKSYGPNLNISNASQIGYRDPQIETDKNTKLTSEVLLQMLFEDRDARKKSDGQFLVMLIISIATLCFAAAPYVGKFFSRIYAYFF